MKVYIVIVTYFDYLSDECDSRLLLFSKDIASMLVRGKISNVDLNLQSMTLKSMLLVI